MQSAARLVTECALELWPHCQVVPFGSQATSMALPGSDVDIAILGVGNPAAKGAAGFSKCASRLCVTSCCAISSKNMSGCSTHLCTPAKNLVWTYPLMRAFATAAGPSGRACRRSC